MKLFYINVGSVKNKYIYLNDYIHTHDFDIVVICETWLGISDHDDTCEAYFQMVMPSNELIELMVDAAGESP